MTGGLPNRRQNCQRGAATVVVLVLVLTCSALAAGVLLPSIARHREAEAHLASERAFHVAEGGIDWAVARLRGTGGAIPAGGTEALSPAGGGSCTLTYTAGTANGSDDDGDTLVDEGDERVYVEILSIGRASTESRAIRVLMRRAVVTPEFDAAVTIDVDVPIFEPTSRALVVDGREHDFDGNLDVTAPEHPAVSSPAPAWVLEDQIRFAETIIGLGDEPSVAQSAPFGLDALVEQTVAAATMVVEPGRHANAAWGDPATGGPEIVYCDGDLLLSGSASGSGYLAVDGDLTISGSIVWHGVILVRGACRMTGGGHTKRVIGALVVGEEVEALADATTTRLELRGTVDLLYSSDAIARAGGRIGVMSVMSWSEVAVP